ncbi:MAG: DUF4912 domain-containing protein, partial [Candidatus Omnitrophica bacterium]|nr:DUF4912 domain-containing protein [Candidatus Omnitrophota bacterium]
SKLKLKPKVTPKAKSSAKLKSKPIAKPKAKSSAKLKSKLNRSRKPVQKKALAKPTISPLKKKTIVSKSAKTHATIAPEYIPVEKPNIKKSVNVDDSTLPELNEETRLRLMARDPNWIHAYWHVSPAAENEAQKKLGAKYAKSQRVLRMHDVTCVNFNGQNSNRTFDIDVQPESKSWNVDVWQDNVSFCAQVGLRTEQGEFYPLAESNFVHTARSSFSDRGDLIWLDVASNACKKPFILTGKAGKGRGKYRWYLTEEDIRAYYANLFPLLRRILRRRLKRFSKKIRIGDMEFEDDDFLFNLQKSRWSRKILLGASEELIETGEIGGGSESISSHGASEREAKKRQFFFELGTELIVYGRTEPDAEVWHGDKKIPLKAISHDKIEARRILTSVKRAKTDYSSKIS